MLLRLGVAGRFLLREAALQCGNFLLHFGHFCGLEIGGQGGFVGTVAGALTLTLLGDVIFAFNLSSYWTVLAEGVLLIAAVLAGTGLQAIQARRMRRHA